MSQSNTSFFLDGLQFVGGAGDGGNPFFTATQAYRQNYAEYRSSDPFELISECIQDIQALKHNIKVLNDKVYQLEHSSEL